MLDQAEIPTVQERGLGRAEVLRRKLAEIERGLTLTVDGAARLPPGRAEAHLPRRRRRARHHPPGPDPRCGRSRPGRVALGTTPSPAGSAGRRSSRARRGHRRADAGAERRPDERPAQLPAGLLDSPADRREASFSVTPGRRAIAPRRGADGAARVAATGGGRRSEDDGFAGLFEDAAAGQGVLVLLLLAAFGWGRPPRALARPREGDGRRLPDRHAGTAATRSCWARPSRSRTRSGSSRWARDARAVAVRAARAALPLADADLGPDGGRDRRRRLRSRLRGSRAHSHRTLTHEHRPRARPTLAAASSAWARPPA